MGFKNDRLGFGGRCDLASDSPSSGAPADSSKGRGLAPAIEGIMSNSDYCEPVDLSKSPPCDSYLRVRTFTKNRR